MLSVLLASALVASVNAIDTISVKGSKFFTEDGNQFFVKGIAYQLVPDDPLIDNKQCKFDSDLMKSIGTNSIRVYHVDPSADHDDCMKTFADAGIYIWLDLDTFDTQIEQTHPQWNETQRDRFAAVMDTFHKYENLAGFFVGNEVLTTENGSVAAPYVKAAARDMKAYRDSKKYRNIPIGYSAADIAQLRPMLQNYLACGSNASEALDFYSLNAYSWCGDSSFKQSGYVDLIKNVTDVNYNIPIFFSETGCIKPRPRDWADQEAIFGDEMIDNWSGSIVYEWIMEANEYGIVSYGPEVDPASPGAPPDGFPRSGKPTPLDEFTALGNKWKTLNPTGVKAADYKPTLTPPPCPAFTDNVWVVDAESSLPTLGQTYRAAQASASTTASGSNAKPTDQQAGESSAAPSDKGAAPAVSAQSFQTLGLGLVGVFVGFCIWM